MHRRSEIVWAKRPLSMFTEAHKCCGPAKGSRFILPTEDDRLIARSLLGTRFFLAVSSWTKSWLVRVLKFWNRQYFATPIW